MRARLTTIIALFAIAALALPASATPQPGEPGFEPTLRTEQTYFHCASPVKVQNVDAIQGNTPSWDTTAPTTSFTAGGGCGFYDNILSGTALNGPTNSAIWTGTFTGNLDSIGVELHRLLAGAGGSVTFPALVMTLTVDGNVLYDGDVDGFMWIESSTGASESATMTFTDLGFLTEHGDGTIERTITLQVDSYNEAQTAWVFDASEVPAGLTFNPEDATFPTVKA
ncbi:hypothetical protein [Euzebya rosea]|uniref:hypothetical protein n=1 Tax=Euzebya rosea TaxID=2052804 RepID=UPI000D3EA41F|nr:hypothetical protein [Euzebya rosea]